MRCRNILLAKHAMVTHFLPEKGVRHMRIVKAIFAFIFAVPSQANVQSISCVAGEGGWGDEDADHLKKTK
jgi:hypothetical protein